MLILLLFGLILIKIVIGNDSDEIVTNYVRCATTKGNYMLFYIMYVYNYHNNLIGPIVLEIYRDWSPRGINILILLLNNMIIIIIII